MDAHWPLPESDWWNEYYTPLSERIARADPAHPGMGRALAAVRAEITLRRHHGSDYDYAGYVLRPDDTAPGAAPGATPDTTAASTIATTTDAHLLTNRKTMTTS